jgi:hypothetical protein
MQRAGRSSGLHVLRPPAGTGQALLRGALRARLHPAAAAQAELRAEVCGITTQAQGQQNPEGFRWADAPRFKTPRGRQIVSEVLLDHRIHPDDFFGYARDEHLVKARKDCAERLSAAGYSAQEIGRMMKRDHTTILNYFPKLRESKNRRYITNKLLEILPPDIREIVQAFAKAEGVSISVLIAQWVGERATYEAEVKIEADALTRAETSERRRGEAELGLIEDGVILALWQKGLDTRKIARHLGCPEHQVANRLLHIRGLV